MNKTAAEISTAPVLHLPEVGSTNEEALGRARRGETGPLFIRADRQTMGRGRHGRVWASPAGNLYVSLLLPVLAPPETLPQVAHVAAVALASALRALLDPGPAFHIKWPNDILIGRAKVAGILVEATRTVHGQACVIGWGVNCAHHPADTPYPTVDLEAATGQSITADALFGQLKHAAADALAVWDHGSNFAEIRASWLRFALPLETPMRVRGCGKPVEGRFQGIDAAGRLLLLGPNGPVSIEAGDVILDERSAACAD